MRTSIWGLDWTPDGRHLVFAWGSLGGITRLSRVSSSGGEPELLGVGGSAATEPSISRRGSRLAYTDGNPWGDVDIWRIEIGALADPSPRPTKLIASSRLDQDPQFSPDGRRIVFASARSGHAEIWVCDADGSNQTQITSFGSPHTGTPRWSPDGRQIAFDSRPEGHSDIFVIGSEGGRPRRITTEASTDVVPSWSRDGKWIYFASDGTGTWQVFKVPSDGGPVSQVTEGGGFAPLASPDGRFIYYAKGFEVPGLWRVPVEGGEESVVLEDLEVGFWGYWAVVDDGIYILDPGAGRIDLFSFATRERTPVAQLEKRPPQWSPGLAVSPRSGIDPGRSGGAGRKRHHARRELPLSPALHRYRATDHQ